MLYKVNEPSNETVRGGGENNGVVLETAIEKWRLPGGV